MSLQAIAFSLGHFEKVEPIHGSILHACLQFIVFILKLTDLLHYVVEVLLEVSWCITLGFESLLSLLLLQIESL